MTADELQTLIDDATFDYSTGASADAIEKLHRATAAAPGSFGTRPRCSSRIRAPRTVPRLTVGRTPGGLRFPP